MKLRFLLFFNSILLLNTIRCDEEIKARVLSRSDYDVSSTIEQQTIQEFSPNATAIDATFDDVIDEIIDSSRQGRNIDGLDEVYADPTVKQALLNGDDTQARNLIREKLCSLGLMECEKRAPVRYIYTQPLPELFTIHDLSTDHPRNQAEFTDQPDLSHFLVHPTSSTPTQSRLCSAIESQPIPFIQAFRPNQRQIQHRLL